MASQIIGPSGAPPTQPVTGPLTDTQLRASPVPVSGTVTATGGLTDTQLRATPVPVSGTVTASGPLTDTQLRATPVPVSGTVTASGPLTDTQLRASAVPVSLATAPALVAGSAIIGKVGIDQTTLGTTNGVTPTPSTIGGWSIFNATSGDGSTALTNSAQAVKTSQGTLGGWYIYNPNTAVSYVPIYNVTAASVTVGTTNPAMVLAIPSLGAANIEIVNGLQFSTAISVAAATTAAGAGAPSVALEANFWYK